MRNLTGGHTDWVRHIEYLSDGTLVTGGEDRRIVIWNVTSGAQLASITNILLIGIREVSPQVIAIAGSYVTLYQINGSMTPVYLYSVNPSYG